MKSPFPGMDPYLEEHWSDVHARLAIFASNQLQSRLPEGLVARVEEYVALEADGDLQWRVRPDAAVFETDLVGPPRATSDSSIAVAEPELIHPRTEPEILRSVRIIDARDGSRIVTAIEFLSLANKLGSDGKDTYRAKRNAFREGKVNFVEVDLLRDGDYVVGPPYEQMPTKCREPYRVTTWRVATGFYEAYAISLRERLPAIRIPLRESDLDVPLELQALVDEAYVTGAYHTINYRRPCRVPLKADDEAWADALLREKGLR